MYLSYIYVMDERKKIITGLEAQKQEALDSLNQLFENFGETLFAHIDGQGEASVEHVAWALPVAQEYLKLKKDIADSEQLIHLTESDTLRLKELETYIHGREEEYATLCREVAERKVELGRRMHGDPAFTGIIDSGQDKLDALTDKIRVTEHKLDRIDGQDANIFSRTGKKVQSLSLRFFLGRDEANLKKAYGSFGESLLRQESGELVSGHEIAGLVEEARELEKRAETLKEELAQFRTERKKLNSTFAAEGGAVKRIQGLERHIGHVKNELRIVYRRFGKAATDPVKAADFAHLFNDEDRTVLEKADLARKTIGEYDREIEKLKTAIAIDEEKTAIEKMRKSIQDHRGRIGAAEKAIADLEERIAGAEKHITELERLL
jgi:predicted  nucleic acid-binding Zn-ribbon protein